MVLDSLLRGYEAELKNAAKSDISSRILNLFSEVKRIQNEQPIDEEQNNQVVNDTTDTVDFIFEMKFPF